MQIGYNAYTTNDAEVYIQSGTFWLIDDERTSAGLLGASIAHEVVHTNQIADIRHWSQVDDPTLADIQYNVNEIEAYNWMLENATNFGLTEKEKKFIETYIKLYYDKLPDEFRRQVDKKNYEIPK